MKEEVHHHHHDEPQTNKYEQALSKYNFDIKDEDVREAVKKIDHIENLLWGKLRSLW